MLFLLLTPLALLCFFLACLAWRRNFRRQALAILAVGLVCLGLVTVFGALSWYGYLYLQAIETAVAPPGFMVA